MILYPSGYGTRLVTFDQLVEQHTPHMHPEAARRGFNFILCQQGKFGIGGGYRPPGTQPSGTTFAPKGKSFHQDQPFPSGMFYIAWDLVVRNPGGNHRAPRWSEVPRQGTQLATDYGVHCNVGEPGSVGNEPWHMQPVPIDGWQSWVNDGRPDIQYNYPIKNTRTEDDMIQQFRPARSTTVFLRDGIFCTWAKDGNVLTNMVKHRMLDPQLADDVEWNVMSGLELEGPQPVPNPTVARPDTPTGAQFARWTP